MISLNVLDVKSFMSSILVHTVFDNFLLIDLDIATFNNFHISGFLNKTFYTEEEKEVIGEREYSKWGELKPIAFSLIRGNKTPLSFKFVFLLSQSNTEKIRTRSSINLTVEEMGGLFLNVKFENGILNIITGTSMKKFTLDKTLENEWDLDVKKFLSHYEIGFEEN